LQSVKRSREKAKLKADKTKRKIEKIRLINSRLKGKISGSRKTKKLLIELLRVQAERRNVQLTPEQQKFIDDHHDSDTSESSSEESEMGESSQEGSDSEDEAGNSNAVRAS